MYRQSTVQSYSLIENARVIGVKDLVSAIWRYKWSAMIVSLVLVPLFVGIIFLIPVKYDSNARLFVRLGRGAVSIDPTANLSNTVSLQESRLAQVNSVKELLTGRELAERVVRIIGAERITAPHGIFETTLNSLMSKVSLGSDSEPAGGLSADQISEQLETEEACRKLAQCMRISSPKEAYAINIDVRTGDPFLSRDLLNTLIEEYQRFHVEAHRSTGSLEFFEEQTKVAHLKAEESQKALRDAKIERGIVDLAAAKSALSQSLSEVKKEMLTNDSELAAVEAELAMLKTQIDSAPEHIESEKTKGIEKLAGARVRERLYELEVAYQEAAAKFKPDHPKMTTIRDQLKAATEIAQSEEGDQDQSREVINPIRQQLELALQTTTAKLAGRQTRKRSLASQIEELTKQIESLNQDEVDINQLTWEASLAEAAYLKTAEARTTARQINALDEQHMSEISVVQPATLSLKKSTPKRLLLVMVSLLVAGLLGFGQAIIRGLIVNPLDTALPNTRSSDALEIEGRESWDELDDMMDGPIHHPASAELDLISSTPR